MCVCVCIWWCSVVCFVVVGEPVFISSSVCLCVCFSPVGFCFGRRISPNDTDSLFERKTHTQNEHAQTDIRWVFNSMGYIWKSKNWRAWRKWASEKREKQKSRIIHFDINDMMETCFSSSGSAGCSRLRKQGCNASRITTGNTSRCLMVLLFLSVRYAPAYYTHTHTKNLPNFSSYFYYIRNKFVASPARVFLVFQHTHRHTHGKR